jgi:hypothetical protein
MKPQFAVRSDGQVDVHLGDQWRLVDEALNDCVSSLPPRGLDVVGPSTYWVDRALDGLHRALDVDSDRPFARGNSTLFRLRDGRVEARHDYDEEDVPGQFIEVEELRSLLDEWRRRILISAASSTSRLPEAYRRNPI